MSLIKTDGVFGTTCPADTHENTVRGTITAAKVKTLNATLVELVPAPGTGFYLKPTRIHYMLDFASAAYDGAAAGEDLATKYTDTSGAKVCADVDHDGFGNAAADAHAFPDIVTSVTPVENAALVAEILSGEWYAAAGDSPIVYEIDYQILPYTW